MNDEFNVAAKQGEELAHRLAQGYYSYLAALLIARDQRAKFLIPKTPPGEIIPVGYVRHKNRGYHAFDFRTYLDYVSTDAFIMNEMERAWLSGSMLMLADFLATHKYFDRHPTLEIIRYIRNGIAHGNRFYIRDAKMLLKYPAHTPNKSFIISPDLNGQPVLFEFMDPGDIVTLISNVSYHLSQIIR